MRIVEPVGDAPATSLRLILVAVNGSARESASFESTVERDEGGREGERLPGGFETAEGSLEADSLSEASGVFGLERGSVPFSFATLNFFFLDRLALLLRDSSGMSSGSSSGREKVFSMTV